MPPAYSRWRSSAGSYAATDNSIALGAVAGAFGAQSAAIGTGATATGNNTVALGAGSLADRDNSVSVGAAGAERQITNVAAGTQATDAVNLGQLDAAVAGGGGAANPLAVSYDAPSKGDLTLGGTGGTMIHGVAAGVNAGDAVNMYQLNNVIAKESQDVTTLSNEISALPSGGGAAMPSTIAVDGGNSASVVSGSGGVAIGNGAMTSGSAAGSNGVAVGASSFAAGPNDTALGGNAQVKADGSTAVGANTVIAPAATNAVAVGESAQVTAASGTAIGQGSSVTAANAVALGQGSVANVANTVSVGTATNQRQITNVAAGVNATDATNVSQLNAALATAKSYTDTNAQQTLSAAKAYTDAALGNVQSLSNLQNQMNDQFQQVNKRIDETGAMGAASTQMAINAAGATGNGRIAAGVGEQSGRSAISVGYAAPLGSRMHVSVGATASGSQTSVGAGFGVDL